MANVTKEMRQRIEDSLRPSQHTLRTAEFLLCEFDCDVWSIVLVKEPLTIDWRVMLDGDLLTSTRHAQTLNVMKSWVLLQTHPALNPKPLAEQTAAQRVRRILHILDYLLLNENQIGFGRRGFMALTENDIRNLFRAVERESSDKESIYQWRDNLAAFLKDAPSADEEILRSLRNSFPMLFEVDTPEYEWTLGLSHAELIRARVFLWLEGLYQSNGKQEFLFSPRNAQICERVYPNVLSKPNTGLNFDELCVGAIESYFRELPGVDVRTAEKSGTQQSRISSYRREFFSLRLLHRFGCEVPIELLNSIDQHQLVDLKQLKLPGRFRTLPFPVPMKALRDGVPFFYEHGQHLTDSYVKIVKAAAEEKMDVLQFVEAFGVDAHLEEASRKLGVVSWSIASYFDPQYHVKPVQKRLVVSTEEYFSAMRRNVGLVDLLRVLYGACESTTGMMMARRHGELLDLVAGKALSHNSADLIFNNRKTGTSGFRQIEMRPIPQVGVDMIKLLTNFQEKLIEAKCLCARTNVFALPTITGKLVSTPGYYNSALDAFCDYFQMLIKDGKRFYFRQHQLRRVFAIAFLYCAGGDAQTLRWFLGQVDPEHLWNYITEAMPGEMLEYVEAYFITEKLQSGVVSLAQDKSLEMTVGTTKRLLDLVLNRFGTANYALIDTDALTDFVAMQIANGMVVEPHFYQDGDGKQYKILVHIKGVV